MQIEFTSMQVKPKMDLSKLEKNALFQSSTSPKSAQLEDIISVEFQVALEQHKPAK